MPECICGPSYTPFSVHLQSLCLVVSVSCVQVELTRWEAATSFRSPACASKWSTGVGICMQMSASCLDFRCCTYNSISIFPFAIAFKSVSLRSCLHHPSSPSGYPCPHHPSSPLPPGTRRLRRPGVHVFARSIEWIQGVRVSYCGKCGHIRVRISARSANHAQGEGGAS